MTNPIGTQNFYNELSSSIKTKNLNLVDNSKHEIHNEDVSIFFKKKKQKQYVFNYVCIFY